MPRAIFTTSAVTVFWYVKAKCVGTKMGDLTQKVDRRFRVTVLQLAVRRAHAAKSLNLTVVTDRWPRPRLIANLLQRAFPALPEASLPDVIALLMRNDADAHRAVGIDSTAMDATTA